MASAGRMSRPTRSMAWASRIATVSVGFLVARSGLAAEPAVAAEYQSAFAGYRYFDAQAPAVGWRAASDAIRDGDKTATNGHGMHDMPIAEAEDHTERHE